MFSTPINQSLTLESEIYFDILTDFLNLTTKFRDSVTSNIQPLQTFVS